MKIQSNIMIHVMAEATKKYCMIHNRFEDKSCDITVGQPLFTKEKKQLKHIFWSAVQKQQQCSILLSE
jgi:hypothetical protein